MRMRLLRPGSPRIGDEEIDDVEVVLAVTREELVLLGNSINEAWEAVEDWEFGTRHGGSPGRARTLHSKISDVLKASWRPE